MPAQHSWWLEQSHEWSHLLGCSVFSKSLLPLWSTLWLPPGGRLMLLPPAGLHETGRRPLNFLCAPGDEHANRQDVTDLQRAHAPTVVCRSMPPNEQNTQKQRQNPRTRVRPFLLSADTDTNTRAQAGGGTEAVQKSLQARLSFHFLYTA